MQDRPNRRLALLVLLGLCSLAGCSSVPDDVSGADYLAVTYWQFETDRELSLVTSDDPEYADLYSRARDAANVKLTDREVLGDFVDFMAEKSFFERAGSLGGPDARIAQTSKGMFVVEANGRPYSQVFVAGQGETDPQSVRDFTDIQNAFIALFAQQPSLQYVRSAVDGNTFFEREQERIQRENREALERAREAASGGRD